MRWSEAMSFRISSIAAIWLLVGVKGRVARILPLISPVGLTGTPGTRLSFCLTSASET